MNMLINLSFQQFLVTVKSVKNGNCSPVRVVFTQKNTSKSAHTIVIMNFLKEITQLSCFAYNILRQTVLNILLLTKKNRFPKMENYE